MAPRKAATKKAPAAKTTTGPKVKKASKTGKSLADYGILEAVPGDDLGNIAELFPRDYSKLRGSLQNGRDNALTSFAVIEGEASGMTSGKDSLVIQTTLNINGSELPAMVPLKHGREFVRRLTDLLNRAEAEGLNVGQ